MGGYTSLQWIRGILQPIVRSITPPFARFLNNQNVTFIGAHDSAFYSTDALILSADQHYNVTKQLDDGIRLLQSQGHNVSGSIELCHTNCLLYFPEYVTLTQIRRRSIIGIFTAGKEVAGCQSPRRFAPKHVSIKIPQCYRY